MPASDPNFHNNVAQISYEKFQTLSKRGKPLVNQWTVLTSIILEDETGLQVVALGTGTKCIGQDKMSADGDILNDSHAEVICRRALLLYIYENLLNNKNNLFLFDTEKENFTIDEHAKFHLFTTQVPCGDVAICPKQDNQDTENIGGVLGETPTKKMKLGPDIFRTGAKCLKSSQKQDLHFSGTDYHVTGVVRTKPGRGTPTLSVSCSDKLARWCHVGLQGALLSLLLKEPIYLSSITVAGNTPFDQGAWERALFKRLEGVSLKVPYCCKKIVIGQANLGFASAKEGDRSPCSASIIWYKAGNSSGSTTEVAVDGRKQGLTKRQNNKAHALKTSKLALFQRFLEVIEIYKIRLDAKQLTYKHAKMLAKEYQESWSVVKKGFKKWTLKDETLLDFFVA